MLKLTIVVVALVLSGCDMGPSQPMDPGTRAALFGALISNQPRPYYQPQPYMMPVYQQPQRLETTCTQFGNMMSCN